MTTIAVIGDVTPEEARPVFEKWFGAWKATGPKPVTTLPAVPLNKPAVVNVPDPTQVQDSVDLSEQVGSSASRPITMRCNSATASWVEAFTQRAFIAISVKRPDMSTTSTTGCAQPKRERFTR